MSTPLTTAAELLLANLAASCLSLLLFALLLSRSLNSSTPIGSKLCGDMTPSASLLPRYIPNEPRLDCNGSEEPQGQGTG
ncbi:hypothetical protein BC567DRAFT_236632 [Phyllosticta citribraziliensis]